MFIDKTGWYLIASESGKTIQESVNSYINTNITVDISKCYCIKSHIEGLSGNYFIPVDNVSIAAGASHYWQALDWTTTMSIDLGIWIYVECEDIVVIPELITSLDPNTGIMTEESNTDNCLIMVKLNKSPSSNNKVIVNVTSTDIDMNSVIIVPKTIEFNEYNYNRTKQIIIKGSGSDDIVETDNITVTLNVDSSSDPDWLGVFKTFSIQIQDYFTIVI